MPGPALHRAPAMILLALLFWAPLWVLLSAAQSPLHCPVERAAKRPSSFPDYRYGYRQIKARQWPEAAGALWESLCLWEEDGETVRVFGHQYLPYIPRYYLGVALQELGCPRAALMSLEASILQHGPIYRGEDEAEHWQVLVADLRRRVEDSTQDCAPWNARFAGPGTGAEDASGPTVRTYQLPSHHASRMFQPIDRHEILVVAYPGQNVYLLDRDTAAFRFLGRLRLIAEPRDHGLVSLPTGPALLSLSRAVTFGGTTVSYFHRTRISAGPGSLETTELIAVRFQAFETLVYRPWTEEILVLDRQRRSLHAYSLSPEGTLGLRQPFDLPTALRAPNTVAFATDATFVGDAEKQRLFQLHPTQPRQPCLELPGEVLDPRHLALDPEGNRLAVIDDLRKAVLVWQREDGRWQPAPLPAMPEISFPVALLFTRDGALLVAQADGKIFELP